MMKKKTRLVSLIMTGAMALSLVGGTGVTAFAHDTMGTVTVNFPVPTSRAVILTDVNDPGHVEKIEYEDPFVFTDSAISQSVSKSVPTGTYNVEVENCAPATYDFTPSSESVTVEYNETVEITVAENLKKTESGEYIFADDVYDSLYGNTYVWGSYYPKLESLTAGASEWFPNSLYYLYIYRPAGESWDMKCAIPIAGGLKESEPAGAEVIDDDASVIGYADCSQYHSSFKCCATYMYFSEGTEIIVPVVPGSEVTVYDNNDEYNLYFNDINGEVVDHEDAEQGEHTVTYSGDTNGCAIVRSVTGGASIYHVEVTTPLFPKASSGEPGSP